MTANEMKYQLSKELILDGNGRQGMKDRWMPKKAILLSTLAFCSISSAALAAPVPRESTSAECSGKSEDLGCVGTSPNPKSNATNAYEKACAGGSAKDCFSAGVHYSAGRLVLKDATKALHLFEKACEGGVAGGCNQAGKNYADGHGAPKDQTKAVHLFERACKGGYAQGCHNAGVFNAKGLGVEKDQAKAVRFYEKACSGDNAKGCNSAGASYAKGDGVEKDGFKASRFYEKACARKSATGCINAGLKYESGEGFNRDEVKALRFYKKACEIDRDRCDAERRLSQQTSPPPKTTRLDERRTTSRRAMVVYKGALSRKEIQRVVKGRIDEIKSCYERDVTANQASEQYRLVFAWKVDGFGRVRSAKIIEESTRNRAVSSCVLRTIENLRFPHPKDGGNVLINYPFIFSPAGSSDRK